MPLINYDDLFLKADNYRNDGQVEAALKAYQEIIQQVTRPEEQGYKARALQEMGTVMRTTVTTDQSAACRDAVNYYEQAAHIFLELNDTAGLGNLYRDVALAYQSIHQSAEAIKYYQKSIEILQKDEHSAMLGITLDKFGVYYFERGELETAIKYIKEGLALLVKEPTAGFFYATSLYDYARVLTKNGQLAEALDQAEESLSWFDADHEDRSFHHRQAELCGLLAIIHLELGNDKDSKKYSARFQKLMKGFDPRIVKRIEQNLSLVAQQK